ncbi:MAG TPA: hypothetical protein VG893_05000 [Terracidiphilus sp.]|nr:hypothetical protein [Terracidiphilus sp.]
MDSTRYCAFNKSRGIFLSLDVSVLDAALEPLKVLKILIEGPTDDARSGIWLQRFKAVPVAQALTPFDLIYLDRDYRVVHAVALTVDGDFLPFKGDPSSALVLPAGTIALSETQPGDQLIVVTAPQAGVVPARTPAPAPGQASHPVAPHPAPAAPAMPAPFLARNMDSGPRQHIALAQAPAVAAAILTEAPPATPRPAQPAPFQPNLQPNPVQPEIVPAAPAPESAPAASVPKPRTAEPDPEYASEPEPATLGERVIRWLYPRTEKERELRRRDRRAAFRLDQPGLIAYFFTGGPPQPYHVDNISVTGFYMHTDHLWSPGTIIRMTLQRTGSSGDQPGDAITVHSRMVRHGSMGGGFEFVLSGFLD